MSRLTFLTSTAIHKIDDGSYPWYEAEWLIPHENIRREMLRGEWALAHMDVRIRFVFCFITLFLIFLLISSPLFTICIVLV